MVLPFARVVNRIRSGPIGIKIIEGLLRVISKGNDGVL